MRAAILLLLLTILPASAGWSSPCRPAFKGSPCWDDRAWPKAEVTAPVVLFDAQAAKECRPAFAGVPCWEPEAVPKPEVAAGDLLLPDRSSWEWRALGAAIALTALDWQQTREFRARGDEEGNPILGRHPSAAEVNRGVAVAILGGVAIWALTEDRTARWFLLAGWIAVEAWAVNNNAKLGYTPKLAGIELTF